MYTQHELTHLCIMHAHISIILLASTSSTARQVLLQEVQRATLELEGLRCHLDALQDTLSSS